MVMPDRRMGACAAEKMKTAYIEVLMVQVTDAEKQLDPHTGELKEKLDEKKNYCIKMYKGLNIFHCEDCQDLRDQMKSIKKEINAQPKDCRKNLPSFLVYLNQLSPPNYLLNNE